MAKATTLKITETGLLRFWRAMDAHIVACGLPALTFGEARPLYEDACRAAYKAAWDKALAKADRAIA